jgi:hypothetical protein
MGGVQRVKVRLSGAGRDGTVELDGVPIDNATELSIHAAVGELTQVTLTLVGVDVDLEADAQVQLVREGS